MSPNVPIGFSILTFNIWGLPGWISKDKDDRIPAIAKKLSSLPVDVVCLQEVWLENDFQLLKNSLKASLPYSHYFYSGVTGSGLCIFTKWPITEILFHQWPLNGYIHMVHHGDWFGGKGVGLVVLDVNGYKVNVYTTHLHAQYHEEDSYLVHRVEQAFDTAAFIRMTSNSADLSILAGDLNTIPDSLCLRLLVHVAGLTDSYKACDAFSTGGTNDCTRNSYSNPSLLLENPTGQRIDYILYKNSVNVKADILKYTFPLGHRIPDKGFSYSDHEAILSSFELSKFTLSKSSFQLDKLGLDKTLSEGISICTSALDDTYKKSTFYWGIAATLFCILFMTPLVFDFPLIPSILNLIILIIIISLTIFSILMATIWCKLEYHGILGARDRMVVLFDHLKREN